MWLTRTGAESALQRRRLAAVAVLVMGLTSTSGSSSLSAASATPASSSSSSGEGETAAAVVVVVPEELGHADFRLAFGSCSRHDKPQSLWGAIRGMRADAFLWLGDAVYADVKVLNKTRVYLGNDYLVNAYETQKANPEYAALVSETRVLGTWDDHDFGMNNAGGEWPEKVFAQKAFLDFLDEPLASPRRRREGVYESYTFRGLGRRKDRSVRLVLLDTRYSMSRVKGELLGEDQWTWLETLLAPAVDDAKKTLTEGEEENRDNDPVDVTIIGSSIQVHADAQRMLVGIIDGVESWGQFPEEKKRLMDLVERSESRTIFLSGDIHHSEIGTSPAGCELPYELVEITSSGMTHGILDEISDAFGLRSYAKMLLPDFLPKWLWPPVGTLQRTRFIGNSFAEVAINFEDEEDGKDGAGGGGDEGKYSYNVGGDGHGGNGSGGGDGNSDQRSRGGSKGVTGSVRLHVRDAAGKVKIRKTVKLSDLEGTWTDVDATASRSDETGLGISARARRHRTECKTEMDLTRWELYRLPFLIFCCFAIQPVVVVVALVRLYYTAVKQLRAHHASTSAHHARQAREKSGKTD